MEDKYFNLIYMDLLGIERLAKWSGLVLEELQLLKMDIEFLKMLCLWVKLIDDGSEKDIMERLRPMLTSLKAMWPEEHKGLSILKPLLGKWRDTQLFSSANFELQSTIQESKQLIQGWCEYYYMFHSSIQCKSSNFYQILDFLQNLQKSLEGFSSYKATKVVSLKKPIDILKDKIVILVKSLKNIKRCPHTRKILRFLNFVCLFANKVGCLAYLYWAKTTSEEIASELNIVLVDTLHRFIPCATDITPLHIGFLKAYDLHPSDSSLHGESVENFVDFFFEHLVIVLKDDFQILRDRLVFLFTFLTNPLCATTDEDSIRNQIYDLFREDTYLLMSIDEITNDYLGQKIIFSDFMMKIDIITTEIRHIHERFPDSQITMELEKLDYIYLLSIQRELSTIETDSWWVGSVLGQLKLYKMELRFLRMFLLCIATSVDETDVEIIVRLSFMITSLQEIWGKEEEKGPLALRFHEMCKRGFTQWNLLAIELEQKILLSKLEFRKWWEDLFHWSFQCKPSTIYKIMKFLDLIINNLNDLVTYKALETVLFKNQIEILEEKLTFLKNFSSLTVDCTYGKELGEFKMYVQAFVKEAACLTFMYWAKDANVEIASETNSKLSLMLQKIKPITPDVVRMYFGTIKAICVQRSDPLIFGHTILSFIDVLLEDIMTILKDDFHILRDDIMFHLTFLNDPPNENAEELICCQIDVLFWDGLYSLLPCSDVECDLSKKKILLRDFMTKIETQNANIRLIYCKFPDPSLYNFPTVISPRFLDFLIQNLRNLEERMISDRKYVSLAKHKITKIKEELITLCPNFNDIFEMQNELKETWLEVVNLVHLTEHVISLYISSWFVVDYPIWYYMAYFSDVFDRVKIVKTKLKEIKRNTMSNSRCPPPLASLFSAHSEQVRPSRINGIIVGFEDEAEIIIGKLIRGHMSLEIVSIVGMGGLGKTTLAKKVYNSLTVKGNFDKLVFCTVSQDHDTRRLLLDILYDIKGVDGTSDKTNDDLAHQIWKCLSRQKYIIVLDDIWDISAWNKIKNSFPNDKNGSRIMFTTRSREVADNCNMNCSQHQLRFLSEAGSWELLQKKVFQNGISPPHLVEVGKLISKNCKGLPLAVCVVAGILSREVESLSWWSEVSENLVSYLSDDEGCMKVLELSYNHLPEYLKPCLLYLGAFPEDQPIKVKHVIRLWIAEGFVQESETKCIEDVAREYFYTLVDRSLVIINGSDSVGGIKSFCVHDLIHDLCQNKCRDGNFFHLRHKIASFSSSDPSLYNHYRVSTQRKRDITYYSGPLFPYTHSLLFSYRRNDEVGGLPLREHTVAQVLSLGRIWLEYDVERFWSMVHLRHIDVILKFKSKSISSSISNLWNIESLMLTSETKPDKIHLPETFWRMTSLRHVKIDSCILKFSDGYEEHEACPKLAKVVSFSKPVLYNGKDLHQLLQRLPAVRELGCYFEKSYDYNEESLEVLDFNRKLESLKLFHVRKCASYLINFPSTLKKLTIDKFALPWTAISAIAELPSLEVLKLKGISFPGPRLDMEDMTFQNLKFFKLYNWDLVEWNASNETMPCLEQLVIECPEFEDLPSCVREISTLKRIAVRWSLEDSARRIKEEQIDLGNEVEVKLLN